MVNHKNVTFTVNKQTPIREPPPLAYGIVINYGKPGVKPASRGAKLKSQKEPLNKAQQKAHRKRNADHVVDGEDDTSHTKKFIMSRDNDPAAMAKSLGTFANQRPQLPGPTKFRKGKTLSKTVDLDCWFTIMTFSDPAQLLEMRTKIASCYRFLRDNPTLWKHSRSFYYGDTLPDPSAELNEFQYAHLRHGHGCMSCGARSTRKTYWPFLRRWCKTCLHLKTIKSQDAFSMFKGENGEDLSSLHKCLPSGMIDSWGNFVGVGPANNHSLKTIYLKSDVQKLIADYIKESHENRVSWHAEKITWMNTRAKIVEERREFARKMEGWEDTTRTSKSQGYQDRKRNRKIYFAEKAGKLVPPITAQEMEQTPSYKRAVAIPKEPNMTSWLQLKPKLVKEVADLRAKLAAEEREMSRAYTRYSPIPTSTTGTSTPSQNDSSASSSYSYPYLTTRMPDIMADTEHSIMGPSTRMPDIMANTEHSIMGPSTAMPHDYISLSYLYSSTHHMPQ